MLLSRLSDRTWLVLIVAAAFAAAVWYVSKFASYMIMPDELGYMKAAVQLGTYHDAALPGNMWFNNYGQLAQVLIAPFYGLFATPTAFDLSHIFYAAVFASAAIPAFLLTRRVTAHRAAPLIAAALTVAVPWMALSGTLMTESVGYAAFAWAMLALHRCLAEPSPRADLTTLVGLGVALFARTQFVPLAGSLAIAIVVLGLREGGLRGLLSALRAHWFLVGIGLAGAFALVAGALGTSILGGYTLTTSGDLLPPDTWRIGRDILGAVAIGAGALPLALTIAFVLQSLLGRSDHQQRALAALVVGVAPVLVIEVGSFAVRFGGIGNDRYLLYLVPLMAACSMALLYARSLRTLPLLIGGALAAWLIADAELLKLGPSVVASTSAFHDVLDGRAQQIGKLFGDPTLTGVHAAAIATMLGTAAIALARWRGHAAPVAGMIAGLVLAFCVVETGYTLQRVSATQNGASPEFMASRDWLDRALPKGQRAGIVLSYLGDERLTMGVYWDTSFWTKRGDRVYARADEPIYQQEFVKAFNLDASTGELSGMDERPYLVLAHSERRFGLVGARVIARHQPLELVQAPRPYRAAWSLAGDDDTGRIGAGHGGRLRVYGDGRPGPRLVTVKLTTTPDAGRGYAYRLAGRREVAHGRVALGRTVVVRARVRVPARGFAQLRLQAADPRPGRTSKRGAGLLVSDVRVAET